MLSAKAKAAGNKIKSMDEDDLQSLSEMIQHEVRHATDMLSDRAKAVQSKVRQFADDHREDVDRVRQKTVDAVNQFADDHRGDVDKYRQKTVKAINENPVPASAIALGVGLLVGLILASGNKR